MRKLYSIIAVLLMSTAAFCQEYIAIDTIEMSCYYNYDFQEDSTSKYSMKSQEMVLQVGTQYSKFISVNNLYLDSLAMEHKDEPVDVAASKIIPLIMGLPTHLFCRFTVIKNYPQKGEMITTGLINHKFLKVTEPEIANWELVKNKDTTILDFSCKLALTTFAGRKYRAWYTLDVPISDGPYKFSGLPGLIVAIKDVDNQHSFELTGIEPSKNANEKMIYVGNEYIELTPQEYVKAMQLHNNQFYNRIQQEDGITPKNDESKASALNKLKARNNFIEKY